MGTTLWVITGILAAAMFMAGVMKAVKGKAGIEEKMPWTEDFSDGQIRAIGAAEVLGAVGLVVPPLTNIAPILAPIAAACLALLMLGAAYTHFRRNEMGSIVPNLVFAGMGFTLAYAGLLA